MLPSKKIEVGDLFLEREYCLIDVRTETEYAQGSIPGSINIPLFNEEEQARIGRVYAANRKAATFLAMDIAGPKIPNFVRRICRYIQGKPLLIYCWRGGMRSHASVTLLSMVGQEAAQLRGGYHQYRKQIYQQLLGYKLKPQVIILKGKSGTGKTDTLRLLEQRGYPVLDLEGLARHRGSSFGSVPGEVPQCQKNFDSLLLGRLNEFQDRPYILLEGESKRIGNICLPDFLFSAMRQAPVIEVTGSLEARSERILADYTPRSNMARLQAYMSLFRLQGVLPKKLYRELRLSLDHQDYGSFVQLILLRHYDRLYDHNLPGKQVLVTIHSDEPEKTATSIASLLDNNAFGICSP
jgi:tRNA 2-selenouridine synthase